MRYTAVDSSVYVSEDCYDSVSVITVSDSVGQDLPIPF
jgi:hypothetical protein